MLMGAEAMHQLRAGCGSGEKTHVRYSIVVDQVIDYLGARASQDITHLNAREIAGFLECLSQRVSPGTVNGIRFDLQRPLPVDYKGIRIDCGCRPDFLVDDGIIVELKAVKAIEPIHEAQVLTYLKLARVKTGLLINFNVPFLKDGIRRFVL